MADATTEIRPGEVFAETAEFDTRIRELLPHYDSLLDAIVRCVPPGAERILELGCGTGELSHKLLACCPQAQLVGIDYSPRMLAAASDKLQAAGAGDRWQGLELDFGEWANGQHARETGTAFDAIVSSLAIHHLSDADKQQLLQQACRSLKAGGAFWNADPLLPEAPALADADDEARMAWAQQHGIDREAVRARIGTSVPCGHSGPDRLATLEAQLQMLREAGFHPVAVPWKHYNLAAFGGFKA
jgi:trans-aconitate 2-methyltransferase